MEKVIEDAKRALMEYDESMEREDEDDGRDSKGQKKVEEMKKVKKRSNEDS